MFPSSGESWRAFERGNWRYFGDPYCYGPRRVAKSERREEDLATTTRILAVVGPGTAFGDGTSPPSSLKDLDDNTILLIESRNSGIKWPQPGDADLRTLRQYYQSGDPRGLSSIHGDGFHVAFADGSVWFLSTDTPFDVLQPFLTVDGALANQRETQLATFRLGH